MSEKRFKLSNDRTNTITFFFENDRKMYDEEIVQKLNELYDENVELKKQLNNCKSNVANKKIKNEQLRQEIVHLKDDLQYYKTKSARLEEELLSTRGCMYE